MRKGAPLGSRRLVNRELVQLALETGISLHSGPIFENHGGFPSLGNLRDS